VDGVCQLIHVTRLIVLMVMTIFAFRIFRQMVTAVQDLKFGSVVRFTQHVRVVSGTLGNLTSTLLEVMIVVGVLVEVVVQVVMKLRMVFTVLITVS